jgi:hypothetical protein
MPIRNAQPELRQHDVTERPTIPTIEMFVRVIMAFPFSLADACFLFSLVKRRPPRGLARKMGDLPEFSAD